MKVENIVINGITGNEIITREGKAPDIYVPKPLIINGNIDTVTRYLEKQKTIVPVWEGVLFANIQIDRSDEKMTISLFVDPKGQSPDSITGKLEFHEDFLKFGVNSGITMQPSELAELIKMNRSCFKDRDIAMNLVKELKSFKAKVDKVLEKVVDDRANYTLHKSQAVESNIPESFFLTVPIFKGQPKESINIEININAENFGCSLISPEANDYISENKNRIIDEQIKLIKMAVPEICIIEV
jgi:hypothetical protein